MDEWKEIAKKGKSGLRGVLRSGTTRETQGGGNKVEENKETETERSS